MGNLMLDVAEGQRRERLEHYVDMAAVPRVLDS